MKLISKFSVIAIAALMLQGCAGGGGMNKQGGGTLIGGALGGLAGSQFGKGKGALLATGIGALTGALIGGQIGAQMDEQDQKLAALSSQQALESAKTGQSVAWRNPDNGHSGTVTPIATYQNSQGRYCREYAHKVIIGGKSENAYGKACRQPDGSWQVMN